MNKIWASVRWCTRSLRKRMSQRMVLVLRKMQVSYALGRLMAALQHRLDDDEEHDDKNCTQMVGFEGRQEKQSGSSELAMLQRTKPTEQVRSFCGVRSKVTLRSAARPRARFHQ
eukprot:767942-Hanusia_phi.AAC.2